MGWASTLGRRLAAGVENDDEALDEAFDVAIDECELMETTEMPYAVYPIKLGALLFCPLHESIHAGQIGILRRMHGLVPIR